MKDKSSAGVSRGKLALIAVLAVILVTVIVMQIPGSGTAPQNTARRQPRTPKRQPVTSVKPVQQRRAPRPAPAGRVALPVIPRRTVVTSVPPGESSEPGEIVSATAAPDNPLKAVLSYDPFAPPEIAQSAGEIKPIKAGAVDDRENSPTSTNDAALLEELRTVGVSLVIIHGDERIARMGPRVLRVGDELGGLIVEEINSEGVVLVENHGY